MSRSASAGRRADVHGATTGAIPAYQRTLAHLTVRARLLTAVVVLVGADGDDRRRDGVRAAGGRDRRADRQLPVPSRRCAPRRRGRRRPGDGAAVRERGRACSARVSAPGCPGKNEGVLTLLDGRTRLEPAPETRSLRLEERPRAGRRAGRDPARRPVGAADGQHVRHAVPAGRRPGAVAAATRRTGCSSSRSTGRRRCRACAARSSPTPRSGSAPSRSSPSSRGSSSAGCCGPSGCCGTPPGGSPSPTCRSASP